MIHRMRILNIEYSSVTFLCPCIVHLSHSTIFQLYIGCTLICRRTEEVGLSNIGIPRHGQYRTHQWSKNFSVSNTKFAQCKNCPDRLEDSRKGEETADSLSNRVFDREPHYDRDARPDQTRPDQTRPDQIHHHCSQWYPLWGFKLMTIWNLSSDPWPNETSDFCWQQTFHK